MHCKLRLPRSPRRTKGQADLSLLVLSTSPGPSAFRCLFYSFFYYSGSLELLKSGLISASWMSIFSLMLHGYLVWVQAVCIFNLQLIFSNGSGDIPARGGLRVVIAWSLTCVYTCWEAAQFSHFSFHRPVFGEQMNVFHAWSRNFPAYC